MTLEQEFWSKIIKPLSDSPPNSCWGWNGTTNPGGYSMFWTGKRAISAHRFSFELHIRKLEIDEEIHHTCGNKYCCNPSHLEALNDTEHEKRHLLTHCSRGHELSGDNVYIRKRSSGGIIRQCKKCRRMYNLLHRRLHP